MLPNAADRLLDHVLATAEALPLADRAQLYRDVAELIATERQAVALVALAAECDALEAKHEQLTLDFQRAAHDRNGGTPT
jgi:hypothetical protein